MPASPEHIGAEWVLEAADSPYVEHALSRIEKEDDGEEGDELDRLLARGGTGFTVEFQR